MNYTEYKEKTGRVILETVKEIIKEEGLATTNRAHHLAHQRFYLMWYLRVNTKISLTDIGRLFKKTHATVLHGIKKHEDFVDYNDTLYKYNTIGVRDYLKQEFSNLKSV